MRLSIPVRTGLEIGRGPLEAGIVVFWTHLPFLVPTTSDEESLMLATFAPERGPLSRFEEWRTANEGLRGWERAFGELDVGLARSKLLGCHEVRGEKGAIRVFEGLK